MKLEVRLFAGLKCNNPVLECFGKEEFYMNVSEGIDVCELHEILKLRSIPLVTVVDGIVVKKDYKLSDDERVGIFPPIAGG